MSRRWVEWSQIGDIPLPAFFQMQPPQGIKVTQARQFGPSKYEGHAYLWIYLASDSGNLQVPTSPMLNAYFAAIDAALQPSIQSPGGARQQLGLGPGLEHVWIDGAVLFDEGLTAPPAMLMVPITFLCG